jgi:type IV pilus assembly protein PilM
LFLPEEKSFADIFAMPIMQDKELKEAVLLELENHIPVSASEVYCDFQKREVLANAKQQEVFIAATPKDIVEGYLRVLGLAGLIPVALEIESLAVARALIEQAPGALATLIIDLGRHRSSSMIFALGGLRFTSDLAFSGRQLTEVLQEKMKITAQAAEELKIKEGLEGEENIFQAMAPLARSLVAQIKNHLEYFYSQRTASEGLAGEKTKVERILLAGEAASLKGLVNLLSQNIGLNVELGNPWVNILKRPLKAVPLLPYEESLSYAAALGLALRGVPQLTNRLLF